MRELLDTQGSLALQAVDRIANKLMCISCIEYKRIYTIAERLVCTDLHTVTVHVSTE